MSYWIPVHHVLDLRGGLPRSGGIPFPTLIRCVLGGPSLWTKFEPDLAALAHKFLPINDGVSVFAVRSAKEECQVLGALCLTLQRSKLEKVYALRIRIADLEHLECEIRHTPGETGVAAVDAWHRNLLLLEPACETLTRRLTEAIGAGEDRLRVVHDIQLGTVLRGFAKLTPRQVSPHALAKCKQLATLPS